MRRWRARARNEAAGWRSEGQISPFLPTSRPRAQRRRGIRLALVLLPLVLVGCAAAVVASATSTSSSQSVGAKSPRSGAAARAGPAQPGANPGGAVSPSRLIQDDRVINRVLGYAPFVRAGLPRQRLIALTFDDGPSPYTRAIVRELLRLRAPATFFIVGQQLRYFSAALRDEIRHGFVIGDHTENHPPLPLMSPSLQYRQIHLAAQRIHDYGAAWPRLFRPPYGLYTARTLAILRRLNMLMVMWSVDPRDWLRPGAKTIVARVLAAARPATIVELHDGGGDRSQTVAALPAMIAGLRRCHYRLVTVPQLLAADPPPRHQPLPHLSE